MAKYRRLIKPAAVKEIEAIPVKKERRHIAEGIWKLADNPRPSGCEKLSGPDRYRLRQGRYRILYTVADPEHTVLVVKVGHRRDAAR
ncbi:MAG: type II toxin-antitoxin system RelE/ParE family toxin [Thermodesulfobacteriota bacterium]